MDRWLLLIVGVLVALAIGATFLFFGTADSDHLGTGDTAAIDIATSLEGRPERARRELGAVPTRPETEAPDTGAGTVIAAPATAHGRTVDAGGAPVPGLSLVLASGGTVHAMTESGADGVFRFVDLPAIAAARLTAAGSGWAAAPVDGVRVEAGTDLNLGDLVVQRALEIVGRVRGPGAKPLADARVVLLPSPEMRSFADFDMIRIMRELVQEEELVAQVRSGDDGRFVFPAVLPGSYAIAAYHPGHEVSFSSAITVKHGGAALGEVVLDLGVGQRLRGNVRDESGLPVAGALVAVMRDPDGMPSVFKTQKARTDENGAFSFDTLGRGQHMLLVRADGFAPSGDEKVESGGDPVEITLLRGAQVSGRIYDQDTGDGLAGATVFIFGQGGPSFVEATSDAEGRYEVAGVPPGDVFMLVRLEGYSPVIENPEGEARFFGGIDLKRPSDTGSVRRDIPMSGGGTVSGRVLDAASGQPIAEARVRALTMDGLFGGLGTGGKKIVGTPTDADGAFRLTGVKPGRVMVVARHPDYLMEGGTSLFGGMFFRGDDPKEGPPELTAGGELAGQIIKMKKGAEVSGSVLNQDDEPIVGAEVHWSSGDEMGGFFAAVEPDRYLVNTDQNGRFHLRGVALAAELKLTAKHPQYGSGGSAVVDTASGRAVDGVRIVVTAGARISGRLRLPEGGPAAGVSLSVEPSSKDARGMMELVFTDGGRFSAVTDDDGAFLVEGLPAGDAFLEVSKPEGLRVPRDRRTVHLEPGGAVEVNIVLAGLLEIRGVVRDAEGKPVPEVFVQATPLADEEDGNRWRGLGAQTDEQGVFVLTKAEKGSAYRLSASRWDVGKMQAGGTSRDEALAAGPVAQGAVERVEAGAVGVVLVLEPTKKDEDQD